MLQDERRLDGIRPRIVRSGILRRIGIERECRLGIRIAEVVAACNGAGLFSRSDMHGRVETDHLNTVPERAPYQPGLILIVDDVIRINGIPIVTSLTRGNDTPFILPQGERE